MTGITGTGQSNLSYLDQLKGMQEKKQIGRAHV